MFKKKDNIEITNVKIADLGRECCSARIINKDKADCFIDVGCTENYNITSDASPDGYFPSSGNFALCVNVSIKDNNEEKSEKILSDVLYSGSYRGLAMKDSEFIRKGVASLRKKSKSLGVIYKALDVIADSIDEKEKSLLKESMKRKQAKEKDEQASEQVKLMAIRKAMNKFLGK